MNTIQPGWYPYNNNPHDLRWWDGNQWTITAAQYQHPQPAPQPVNTLPATYHPDVQQANQLNPEDTKTLKTFTILTITQIAVPLTLVFLFGWIVIPFLSNPSDPPPLFGFFGLPYDGLPPVIASFLIAVPAQLAIIITGFVKARKHPHLKKQGTLILFKSVSITGLVLGSMFLLLAIAGSVLYALALANGAVYVPSN